MKKLNLSVVAIVGLLGANQQALACDKIDIQGNWDLFAGGHVLRIGIVPGSGDSFMGTITSPSGSESLTRVYEGDCDDSDRSIEFVRRSQPVGKLEQAFEAHFWSGGGAPGAAGNYWHTKSPSSKGGFYMVKEVPIDLGVDHCNVPTLYYDSNYQGPRRIYGPGTQIPDLTGDGDEFSSACVPRGYTLLGYRDDNFGGAEITIIGPDEISNLESNHRQGQRLNWGDEMSSLKIE